MFEEFGGVDGLYLKMLATNVPTSVQLMWIPFSELDIRQQFLLPIRLSRQLLVGLWNARDVSTVDWIFNWVQNINKDITVFIVCPFLEFVIPSRVIFKITCSNPYNIFFFIYKPLLKFITLFDVLLSYNFFNR